MATTAKKTPPAPVKTTGTPLTPKLIAKAAEIGITGIKTDEALREKLYDIFRKQGVVDVEGDSTVDLLDMASNFVDEAGTEEEAPAPVTKGKGKKAPAPAVEEEPEEEATDEEDAPEEEGEEEAAVEEEEEVVVAKPKKASGKATAKKAEKATNVEEDMEELVEEVKDKKTPTGKKAPAAAKSAKAKSARTHKLLGVHWEDLTAEQKEKAIKPFRKLLPEKLFNIVFLHRSFIVKFLGKTNEHNIFKYHLLRLQDNGKLEGIFVSHRFKTTDEFSEYLPDDLTAYKLNKGESCSYIHPFHQDQAIEMLTSTGFLKESIARATKQDTKMQANRQKLQDQLEEGDTAKTTKKAVPAVAGKAVTVVAAAPAKKTVVATTAVPKAPAKPVPAPAKPVVAKKK